MDYKEEQDNELEALESIYPEELEKISDKPYHCFRVLIKGEAKVRDNVKEATVYVQITHTEKYPDEVPVMEVVDEEEALDDFMIDQLQETMKTEAEENLGMVMVFTLISVVQEKLNTLLEQQAQGEIDAIDEKKREEDEAERKKFEGTKVTVETFLAWREKFEADMNDIKRQQGLLVKQSNKLTGIQLFQKDHTMDDSDVKFLEDEGDKVAVDESLFQDLEDLDLDDDLDDEDYDPKKG